MILFLIVGTLGSVLIIKDVAKNTITEIDKLAIFFTFFTLWATIWSDYLR